MVKKALGIMICLLLAGCAASETEVIKGLSPGIEYHNQTTAPWPWVSVVPSERALALKEVDFDSLSKHFHFDISFEPRREALEDVRAIVLDYAILPEGAVATGHPYSERGNDRPHRYFMVASFYKLNNRPPCPADFQVTASLRIDKAGIQEAMRLMSREIIEEVQALSDDELLTPGRKITVNLD